MLAHTHSVEIVKRSEGRNKSENATLLDCFTKVSYNISDVIWENPPHGENSTC